MDTLAEYLETIPDPAHRQRMADVVDWVATTYPRLELRIAWNQPMFTDHGTYIIGFSASTKHMAASPEGSVVARFADRITEAGLEHTKMLIRLPWDAPVAYDLLSELIEFNITDKAECTSFWRK
ncbi:MAG: iron chaperone [Propionibacteriaceae bacterium]|jgi:uncharacterized protein YdhG (YjbR/CyaY superfamily)|nr:iron chaperone [Propionibacteriaceae bacterium]